MFKARRLGYLDATFRLTDTGRAFLTKKNPGQGVTP